MPRGISDSFGDGLAKVMQQISLLKMAPDADYNVISDLENIVLGHLQQQNVNAQANAMQAATQTASQVSGQPPMDPAMMQAMGQPGPMSAPPVPVTGPPGGLPVQDAGLSRAPMGMDQSALAAALAQQMGGQ